MRMRPHKYGAKRTTVDGIPFASQAEARCYSELRLLEQAGAIRQLRLQPRYPLLANMPGFGKGGVSSHVADYVADFEYIENGALVTVDVKGFDTALSRLKRKWFAACYGREVKLVRMAAARSKRKLVGRKRA